MAGRVLRRTVLQAQDRTLKDPTVALPPDVFEPTRRPAPPRPGGGGRGALLAATLIAGAGWATAGWEHFVAVPRAANTARVAYALDLVDRFDDTPAHRAYVALATDMKPWWEAIEDLQHRIQNAPDDAGRDALIAERDASLVAFVEAHALAPKIDLLIGSFDTFTRCLVAQVCDEAIVEQAISVDVKRIWRTFRPWILHRRNATDGDRSYGRDLEDLYFRFVG